MAVIIKSIFTTPTVTGRVTWNIRGLKHVKAVILQGSRDTDATSATIVANWVQCWGVTDGIRAAYSASSDENAAVTHVDSYTRQRDAPVAFGPCFVLSDPTNGSVVVAAKFVEWTPSGVVLDFITVDGVARPVEARFISGPNVQVSVGSVIGSGLLGDFKTITPGFKLGTLFTSSTGEADVFGTLKANGKVLIGFADYTNGAITQGCAGVFTRDGIRPSETAVVVSDKYVARDFSASALFGALEVSTVTDTSFRLYTRETADSVGIIYLAVDWGPNQRHGVLNMESDVGTATVDYDFGFEPQFVCGVQSLVSSVGNLFSAGTVAGSLCSWSLDATSGVSLAWMSEDNVATFVTGSLMRDDVIIELPLNDQTSIGLRGVIPTTGERRPFNKRGLSIAWPINGLSKRLNGVMFALAREPIQRVRPKMSFEYSQIQHVFATGTGDIALDVEPTTREGAWFLMQLRIHFSGGSGTAALTGNVNSWRGSNYDHRIIPSIVVGTGADYREGMIEVSEPLWFFGVDPADKTGTKFDSLTLAWTNPASGSMTWGLEAQIIPASGVRVF